MRKSIFFLSIFIITGLVLGGFVAAQDDEKLTDSEPKTLPNSPFYFLKDFWRNLRLIFTFNSVKKAELRLQFASEMLAEAQKMAEETDNQELFQRAIDKYQREVEKLETQAGKAIEKAKDEDKIQAFQNRFERKIEVHQRVMNKLEERFTEKVKTQEKIQEVKQRTMEHLNTVKERLIERFKNHERNCENLCGDGTCQEIVCMAIGCPCAETPITCPQDCK